ncbi:MAG: hypothetical protein LBC63_10925 [Holophagales bacterium]|jgi:hypothetical protein|nr:hypothetical protein [Holophagales bacterium]
MFRIVCRSLLFAVAATSLCAQGFDFGNVFLAKSVRASRLEYDLQKQAVIYRVNDDKLVMDNAARKSVTDRLAPYHTITDIGYAELDTAQYEVCCDMFGLDRKPKQEMLVLYFNGNAAQFPNDNKDIDLLREFRKLGWVPLDARLDEFAKINPYNQEAIAIRFSEAASKVIPVAQASMWATLPAATRDQYKLPKQDRDQEADAKVVSLFIDALRSVNALKSLDWMANDGDGLSPMGTVGILRDCPQSPILLENQELQREAAILLESLGKEIAHYPYSYFRYKYWAGVSAIVKGYDPRELLDKIKFYPISPDGYGVYNFFPDLAVGLVNPRLAVDSQSILDIFDNTLKFMDYGAQWMLEQDPRLDGIFGDAYADLAIKKAEALIQLQRYSDLEKHLEDTWQTVGPRWTVIVNNLRNPRVALRGGGIGDLPDTNKKRVDAILDQQPRPMAAKPQAAANDSDDGGISPERKNLNALERFIRLNPDAYYAMDMYCRDAAKFLPDGDIEKNIYNYARITRTPPSLAAYSKMEDKENWARLASRIISEGLQELCNAPFGLEKPLAEPQPLGRPGLGQERH